MPLSNRAFDRKIEEARERAAATVDGVERPKELEERINMVCARVLNTADGEMLMNYIKSITVDVVEPPTATDAQLRSREGMRRLCGILDTRRRMAQK